MSTRFTSRPVCPHCGHEHRDVWEWFSRGRESTEYECDKCERPFHCQQHVTITYSTVALAHTEGATRL